MFGIRNERGNGMLAIDSTNPELRNGAATWLISSIGSSLSLLSPYHKTPIVFS